MTVEGYIEARHPNADFLTATAHALIETIQQALETRLNAVGDDVLGDLALELIVGVVVEADDLFDAAVESLAGFKQVSDRAHASASKMNGTVIAIGRINAEEAQRRLAIANPRIKEDRRDTELALKFQFQ